MATNPLEQLATFEGRWRGNNRLWVRPGEPHRDSDLTARVETLLGGRFVRIDYTWSVDGEPQEGSFLFAHDPKRDVVTAVWIDTWHVGDHWMSCEGEPGARRIAVRGSYGGDEGPAWGWWTEIEPAGADAFVLRMYNVPPGMERVLATEARLTREPPAKR